jgi:hypothetical protein
MEQGRIKMRKLCMSHRLFSTLILLSVTGILFAQQAITGTVKDERGEPVIGASITVKENKTVGTITDLKIQTSNLKDK